MPWILIASLAAALAAQLVAAVPAAASQPPGVPGTPGYGHPGARAAQAAPSASGAGSGGVLKTLYSTVLHGGYVSAGVGLRDLGHGRIVVSQIPSGSTVVAAFLLWDVLDNSDRAADARGQLNGTPFVGTMIGTGSAPCWPASNNYAFYADVTTLVAKGNGGYTLTGMPSSLSNADDPWNLNGTVPFAEGASLVVVYSNSGSPLNYVGLSVGGTETPDDQYILNAHFSGFSATSPTSADKTTFIVADGQSAADGPATFNGTDLVPGDFQGSDPQAVPPYSNGDLWDTSTYNVGAYVAPGSSTASATITGTNDCLVWVGQALSVATSSGSSGKVIVSFGDSISAGEGGPTPSGAGPGIAYSGYPDDSTAAYPTVLASSLGAINYNFSQSGACATTTALPNCRDNKIGRTGRPNTVEDELSQARPYNLHPSLITLTVGADDISFATCIKNVLHLPLSDTDKPCSDLPAQLTQIQNNVLAVLKEIGNQYPGVPVLMTRYFFPLPTSFPVSNSHSVCGFFNSHVNGLYLDYLAATGQYYEATKEVATGIATSAVNTFLNGVVSSGQAIEKDLDGALTSAVAEAHQAGVPVTTVQLNFTGHDFCQDYPGGSGGWVLGPGLYVFGSLIAGIFSKSGTLQYTPSDRCFTWTKGICGSQYPTVLNKTGSVLGVKYDLTVSYDINDFPHPTVSGQQAIARQLSAAATSLIGSAPPAAASLTSAVRPLAAADASPGSILGTVTDAANPSGLAGVCVLATSADGGSGFGGATTATDGTYQISNLPPDSYTVEFDPTCGSTATSADAAQLYPSAVQVPAGNSATGVNATLTAAASISGTVTDATDPGGLAGVCVTAISAGGGIGFASAVTATDGTYTLPGLPADSYTVTFDPTCNGINSSPDLARSTPQPVAVTAGGSVTGVDATLTSGGAISGTVTDASNPGGLSGVCVTALSSDGGAGSGTATTGGDGSYEIDNLPPDSYTVEFDPTCGGSITSVDAPQRSASPVAVTAGSTSSGVNAVLAELGVISGQVTDPANPGGVSGVCVLATADSGSGAGSAVTGSSGFYTISQLTPGAYTVQFDPSCGGTVPTLDLFQAAPSPVTVTAGGTTTADAALSATGAISGTITDAAHPGGLASVCVSVASADQGSGSGAAVTAGNGTYTVTGLPADTYTVTFDPTCGGRVASVDTPQSSSPAQVTAGNYAEVDAVLSGGGAISGKVTDHAHPGGLSGVCVTATSSDGRSGFGTAQTGSGGAYQVKGLSADTYLVVFDPTCGGARSSTDVQQSTAKPVTVTEGTTTGNVNATLAVAAAAKLTAYAPAKQAILNASYSYTFKATGRPAASFTVASGQFPTGLSLNVLTGTLSGKPTKKGTFSFQVSAWNGYGAAAVTPKLTITVAAAAPPRFTADSPGATATVGRAYSYRFAASGFPAPRFTVSSGHLPNGLTLNSVTGVLSGKPTVAGRFTFTITASNGVSPSARTPTRTIVVRKAG